MDIWKCNNALLTCPKTLIIDDGLCKKHLPNNRKSSISDNFVLHKILLVLGKVEYCRLIPNPGCESTLTKLNKKCDRITRDPEWVEALQKQKIG